MKQTISYLNNLTIYSIFVRNHSEAGTFKAIESDLERIKKLGVDVIWFMPIHPIGDIKRKGVLGSPYANKDFRTINPEFGTLDDFISLTRKIHSLGMKVFIDVVYHHTSPDSTLAKTHPQYFFKNEKGELAPRIADWSDVVDLDYDNKELWDYQIDSLKFWASIVDGFRCDVASLVPTEFWKKAKTEVQKVNESCIFLAESVDPGFIRYLNSVNVYCAKDAELYKNGFDIEYDYDIFYLFKKYLRKEIQLQEYLEFINYQSCIFPKDYVKLRFLENHDTERIASYGLNNTQMLNLFAFMFFLKGSALLYAGEEFGVKHTPSLFDKDVINTNTGIDYSNFISILINIKKMECFRLGQFMISAVNNQCAIGTYETPKETIVGIFAFDGKAKTVKVAARDGTFTDLISKTQLNIKNKTIRTKGMPIIVSIKK